MEEIVIKGAREHNLKDISLVIPRHQFVVITGLSGSGKSSLAFDTVYAEGQRRYVESLSAYARQFLQLMEKPDVDEISGLSPAISIEQKKVSHNPRSTVGTVTEIYDYLRLLYARVGIAHCAQCGKPITSQTVDQIADVVEKMPVGTKLMIMAPLVRRRKGEYRKLFDELQRQGFLRIEVDGEIYRIDSPPLLDRQRYHDISLVVDRLIVNLEGRGRLVDSLELALDKADDLVAVQVVNGGRLLFSRRLACSDCGISFAELSPRLFSFNNPHGACPECSGLGRDLVFDPDLIVPDISKSLGPFIPLIIVNCMILGRQEAFASKNGIGRSLLDAMGMGLGFTLTLLVLSSIREILGSGTLFGMRVMWEGFAEWGVMTQAPGAFITLGCLIAGANWINARRKA